MSKIESLTSKELLDLFNKVTGQSVKRFADRKAGLKRVLKLMEDPVRKQRVEALLGLASTSVTLIDAEAPLPTIAEALEEGLEKGAKRQGVPALRDKARKLGADVTPIKGNDKLVAVKGRVVRKENANKVLDGESLYGEVAAPPAEKDALENEFRYINLNYRAKKSIKPLREGTMRHRLLGLMQKHGVTIEEVMGMFGISGKAAVYKLREFQYQSGYGLEVRNGRVFVTDK